MIRYRKTTIAVSNTYGMYPGTLLAINGRVLEVTKVLTDGDTIEVRAPTRFELWLKRNVFPPYRIGREGSSDRVILRLDDRGLYLSSHVWGIRLRVALGSDYRRTLELYRPQVSTDVD